MLWGTVLCAVTFSIITGLYPLYTRGTPNHSRDNQKRLKTHCPGENHCLASPGNMAGPFFLNSFRRNIKYATSLLTSWSRPVSGPPSYRPSRLVSRRGSLIIPWCLPHLLSAPLHWAVSSTRSFLCLDSLSIPGAQKCLALNRFSSG